MGAGRGCPRPGWFYQPAAGEHSNVVPQVNRAVRRPIVPASRMRLDELSNLRLAGIESAEDLARRIGREKTVATRQPNTNYVN